MTVTFVMSCYGQPMMMAKQLETISSYPKEILDQLTLIVVDDHGSPQVAKEDLAALPCKVELYRILDDIHWNQPGARNLGMARANGWCVMLDPDMVISSPMAIKIVKMAPDLKRGIVIRFGIVYLSSHERQVDMTSPNTYIIHRDDFMVSKGYDEDYAGNKGWSDVQLLHTLRAFFGMQSRDDIWADYYDETVIPDAKVLTLNRSYIVNKALHLMKCGQARRGGWKRWVQRHKKANLRFHWERLL